MQMRQLGLEEVWGEGHLPGHHAEKGKAGMNARSALTRTLLAARSLLVSCNDRPVILDPADPTWDVGNGTAWRWDVLAKEAESCFNGRCFLQAASGAPEQPWEGPVSERTPGTSGLALMC